MQTIINPTFQKDVKRSYKTLTKEEEYNLVEFAQNGCKKSQNKLVNSQLPAIISIAKFYVKTNEHNFIEDLIGYGVIGLVNAINDFDITRGVRLYSFAYNYIRNNIRDQSQDNRLIRNSRAKSKSRIIKDSEECMFHPNDITIVNGKKRVRAEVFNSISFDSPVCTDGSDSSTYSEIIGDDRDCTDSCTNVSDVSKMMKFLNEDEQKLTQMVFGLNDNPVTSLSDIGASMIPPVSRQTMSIKWNKIKTKLQNKFVH